MSGVFAASLFCIMFCATCVTVCLNVSWRGFYLNAAVLCARCCCWCPRAGSLWTSRSPGRGCRWLRTASWQCAFSPPPSAGAPCLWWGTREGSGPLWERQRQTHTLALWQPDVISGWWRLRLQSPVPCVLQPGPCGEISALIPRAWACKAPPHEIQTQWNPALM